MSELEENWIAMETGPGITTRIMNNYANGPSRFKVETKEGSVIRFSLEFGYTATVKNRGDITGLWCKDNPS